LIGTIIIYPTVELASGVIRYVDALVGALLIGTALLFPRGVMGLFDRFADAGIDPSPSGAAHASFKVDEDVAALSPGE
jgi:hypothetical protein